MNPKFRMKAVASLILPALVLGLASTTYANDAATKTGAQMKGGDAAKVATYRPANISAREVRASKLIGTDVSNAQGENLGEIKDLVIDVTHGRVHYAVLSFGGFLGMGDKLFAFPMGAFNQATDGDKLILNVDKSKLKAAPGFEAKYYPDWNAAKYNAEVDRYFGPKLALKSMPNQQLRRASELLGKDVNDRDGKDVGEIDDLVVNVGTGKVHYAVLEFDKSWSLNDKLLAVPLNAFTYTRDGKDLVLSVDRSTLDTKRAFDKNSWPDINDTNYVQDVDRYLILVVPASTMESKRMRDEKTSMNTEQPLRK
jgi:sporulation protein YlmC with PRC-barrel domain